LKSIIRILHKKEIPYLQVNRETIKDSKLDFTSLGFLIYLLSKPDDWIFIPKVLAKERGIHVSTIRRAFKKLETAGYCYISVDRIQEKKTGRFSTTCYYVVFEDEEARQEFLGSVPYTPWNLENLTREEVLETETQKCTSAPKTEKRFSVHNTERLREEV
jgi:hypothetical protein